MWISLFMIVVAACPFNACLHDRILAIQHFYMDFLGEFLLEYINLFSMLFWQIQTLYNAHKSEFEMDIVEHYSAIVASSPVFA